MPFYRIRTVEISTHFDPLKGGWSGESITTEEVKAAIEEGAIETRDWNDAKRNFRGNSPESKAFHINRIATLYRSEIEGRIILAIEPSGSALKVRIHDGNHRFAAAVLRGDEFVDTGVLDEECGDILELFPSAIELEETA